METNQAQENLRNRLVYRSATGEVSAYKKIAILRTPVRNSTASKCRYFIVEENKIVDITGILARAIGSKWNEKTGTLTVQGGDGSDAVNLLSIRLFNNSTALVTYNL